MLFIEFAIANPTVSLVALILALVAAFFLGQEYQQSTRESRLVDAAEVTVKIEQVGVVMDGLNLPAGMLYPSERDELLLIREEVAMLREQLASSESKRQLHLNAAKAAAERTKVLIEAMIEDDLPPLEDLTTQTISVPVAGGGKPRRLKLVTPALAREIEDAA